MEENVKFNILLEICKKRKSTRVFSAKKVRNKDLEKIKEIAITSPYASAKKNWDLVFITDRKTIKEMAALVKQRTNVIGKKIKCDFTPGFQNYSQSFTFFENAPVLAVLSFRVAPALSLMTDEDKERISQWERDNYVKSISCVAMLVLLAATSLGLGACYMTGPLLASDQLSKLVNLKTGKEIGAIIPVGYSGGG